MRERTSGRPFSHQDLSLVAAGVVVTSVPVAIGYLFGRYVPKTCPVLLMGGRSQARLQAVRHPSIVKEEARSPMPTLWLHWRLCVCQCAADGSRQFDPAFVGGWNGIRSVIGHDGCGRGCGANRLGLCIMAALVVII